MRQDGAMTTDQLPEFTADEIRDQLAALQLETLDQSVAYALGGLAAEIVRENGYAMAVQIVIGDYVAFKVAQGEVSTETDSWLRRKAAVAVRDARPSLLTRLLDGTDPSAPVVDDTYAASGGSFPLIVAGAVVGTITASGAPDVVDHDVVTTALRSYLAN